MRKSEQDEQTGKKKKQETKAKPSVAIKHFRTEVNKARRIARDAREKARHAEKWKLSKSPKRGFGRLMRRNEIIDRNRPIRERARALAHHRAVLAWQVFKSDNPGAHLADFLAEFHKGG